MYYKKLNRYLVIKTLFLKAFFIVWSTSAVALPFENSVKIVSENDICMPASYESILTRIEKFASYREIDDHIVWSDVQSQWLPNAVEYVLPAVVLEWFYRDIKPLDMTMSVELPEDPQKDELKRSKVWMAFSPLELPKRLDDVYPKIPLICSIMEEGEGSVVHRCDQTEGLTYAVQSFSSILRVSRHDCGVRSSFEIDFNLHRQQVEAIYRSIIGYYRWPEAVLSVVLNINETELFSVYFQNLYNQLLLL